MKSLPVYNLVGEEIGSQDLNPDIFDLQVNQNLIKQVVDTQIANARLVLAHVKNRSDVRGGGKKPWKQKGTGRARHGTIRSPLWRHGGVVFGPSNNRNFSKNLNKKMKKKALLMTLSDKANHENIRLLDKVNIQEPKTQKLNEFLNKVAKDQKVLIVLDDKNPNVFLSARNLQNVKVILADSLNVVDLLKYKTVIMPVNALSIIEKVYLSK